MRAWSRSIAARVLPPVTRFLTLFVAVGAPSALATLLAPVLARFTGAMRWLAGRAEPRAMPVGLSLSRSQLLTSKG
jgi:hypothetical protein